MSNKRKGMLSIILFAFALLLLAAADIFSGFANWYAQNVYPFFTNIVGRIYSPFPYSAAEILIYLLLLCLVVELIQMLYSFFRKQKTGKQVVLKLLSNICLAASVLFLIYTAACGMNYKRTSFAERNDIKVTSYTKEDLKELCLYLTGEVNTWSEEVKRNRAGVAVLNGNEAKSAVQSMQNLGNIYEELAGYYPMPKKLLIPQILSYQSLSGIYSPFTLEANYNNDMVPYNIPFTQCHELSHLKGIMQEEEANFVAYLACKESSNPAFNYSGNMLAWLYSMNVLYRVAPEAYSEIRAQLSEGAEIDLEANDVFWEAYEGPVADAADKVNDTYLKANGQDDGVKSYNRMVDLLVAYEILSKK